MEQCSPFAMVYLTEEEVMMGELRQYILQTRMEMEATVLAAQEEILKKDEQLNQMKELLMLTIKERDEAQFKFQKLMLEKNLLIQELLNHHHQRKANTTANCLSASSSESEESSIISSPSASVSPNSPPPLMQSPTAMSAASSAQLPPQVVALLSSRARPLPEKGRLLKAVMEAGPLLQTLLLAGPLPQWQHPPPKLNSTEIPPVSINTNPFSSHGKRGMDSVDGAIISSPKYQRVG